MNVFDLRDKLIEDYASYIRSFIQIRDDRVRRLVDEEIAKGLLWPEALIQLNPAFEPGLSAWTLLRAGAIVPFCDAVAGLAESEHCSGLTMTLRAVAALLALQDQVAEAGRGRRDCGSELSEGSLPGGDPDRRAAVEVRPHRSDEDSRRVTQRRGTRRA